MPVGTSVMDYIDTIDSMGADFNKSLKKVINSMNNSSNLLDISINGKNIQNFLLDNIPKLNIENLFYDEDISQTFNPFQKVPKILLKDLQKNNISKENYVNLVKKWDHYLCNNGEYWSHFYKSYLLTEFIKSKDSFCRSSYIGLSDKISKLGTLTGLSLPGYEKDLEKNSNKFLEIVDNYHMTEPIYSDILSSIFGVNLFSKKKRQHREYLKKEKQTLGNGLLNLLKDVGNEYRKDYFSKNNIKLNK